MNNPREDILEFMSSRPDTVAIIGYGSGINPQKGQEKRKPQIDLIVVVDDLKKWHLDNISKNPSDYSFSARMFFRLASKKMLRSGGKICYMTYIPFNSREYKIGTIQKEDFEADLSNWETFYLAGRMQKPILVVKAPSEIQDEIVMNRKYGVNATKLLIGNKEVSERDFYISLAGVSYIGDTRMGIAENPDKVKNIVDGRFDFYQDNYGEYAGVKDGIVSIDGNDVSELPLCLDNYLKSNSGKKSEDVVYEFFKEKNKGHSLAQTIKGLFTTGPVRSIKYVSEKLKRRKRK